MWLAWQKSPESLENKNSIYPPTPEGTKEMQKSVNDWLTGAVESTPLSEKERNNKELMLAYSLLQEWKIDNATFAKLRIQLDQIWIIDVNSAEISEEVKTILNDALNSKPSSEQQVVEEDPLSSLSSTDNGEQQNNVQEQKITEPSNDLPQTESIQNPNNNLENENSNENQDAYKDSPYYDMFARLKQTWHITEEQFNTSVEKLKNADKEQSKQILIETANWIADEKVRNDLTKYYEWEKEEVTEENYKNTDFYKDTQLTGLKLDEWFWWLEQQLAESYISIPNRENNAEDTKWDINTSMNIVTDNIIEWNSKEFRKANNKLINDIKSEQNIEKKYFLLKDLHKESLKEDAKFWWKKATWEIIAKKSALQKKYAELKIELDKLVKQATDTQKQAQLTAELEQIQKQAIETAKFEWDINTLSSELEADQSPDKMKTNEATL